MGVSAGTPQKLRFGVFEVDLREAQLSKHGHPVRIQSQPFQILALLLERGDEIVTREELRRKLWSEDTFVDFDRSLNKAMNKLRQALGDSAENPRFIETVPRRGYRFIAPVGLYDGGRAEAASSTDLAVLEVNHALLRPALAVEVRGVPVEARRKRAWLWRTYNMAVTLAVLVCVALLIHRRSAVRGAREAIAGTRPSVAVLDFKNRSGDRGQQWLATALSEWLATELEAGGEFRAVPAENAARLTTEFGLTQGDGLSKASLQQINKNFGVDLLISGSYAVVTSGKDDRVRLDLKLLNARTGDAIGAFSDTGAESSLFDMVQRAGAELRVAAGVRPVTAGQQAGVRLSFPASAGAAKLYSEGLAKLRIYDALAARDLLTKAVAAAPRNAMARSALASAWRALGYDDMAKAEAKTALDLAAGLGREQHLQIEARYNEITTNWGKAIETYRTLFEFFPDNLDYGLALANAQISAGQGHDALATLLMLRSLAHPAREDPRIDFVEARARESLGNFKLDLGYAAAAARKAQAAHDSALFAKALDAESWALENLGELNKAASIARQAQRLFERAGDLNDVAASATLQAIALQEQGDLEDAERMFTQGLNYYRRTGNQRAAAAELNNIGVVAENLGNLEGAIKSFQESRGIYGHVNYQDGLALTSSNMADVLLALGRPVPAERLYMRAFDICQRIGDRSKAAGALEGLASVLRAEGNVSQAQRYASTALRYFDQIGDRESADRTRLLEAEMLLEHNDAAEAAVLARHTAEDFERQHVASGAAFALAVASRASLIQGRIADARNAIAQAYAVTGKNANWDVRLFLAIMAARVQAASSKEADRADAVKILEAAVSETERDGMVVDEYEARLALGEIKLEAGETPEARAYLTALRNNAASRRLGFISNEAATILARTPDASSPGGS